MSAFDHLLAFILGTLMYVGGYQVYFYLQERTHRRSRSLPKWMTAIDERIPRRPGWVWVYTALYYPTVVLAASFASRDFREFAYTIGIFLVLLAILTTAYFLKPVQTPEHWRRFERTASIHHRTLAWVQRIDGSNNCFPSGHAAISVLTGYLLSAWIGSVPGVVFAVLVMLSCLFCKQHYVLDIIGGAIVGAGCAWMHYRFVLGA